MKRLIMSDNLTKMYIEIEGKLKRTYIAANGRVFVSPDFNNTEIYDTFLKSFDATSIMKFDNDNYGGNFND